MIIEMLQAEMLKLGHREYVRNPCGEEIYLDQRTSIRYRGVCQIDKRHYRMCNIILAQKVSVTFYYGDCESETVPGPFMIEKHDLSDPRFCVITLAESIVKWLMASSP